jgi:hypothetical protein
MYMELVQELILMCSQPEMNDIKSRLFAMSKGELFDF